jgi:hypothetical protein
VTFDPLAYIASYADLIAAFATDAVAGVKHYIESGYQEGRRILFDALGYIARYGDIQAVFGTDVVAATKHYIQFGSGEGRSAPTLKPVELQLTISRSTVNSMQTSVVTWDSANAHQCIASGDWSGIKTSSGRLIVDTSSVGEKRFKLYCANPLGGISKTVQVIVEPIRLSSAGLWSTIRDSDVTKDYNGGIANTFHGLIRLGTDKHFGLVSIGWGYSGFGETAAIKTPAKINAFLLAPNAQGLLTEASERLTPDPLTNGGGSVVTTDFNGDGFDDIILLAHNESPFLALPSTIFWGTQSGRFTKQTLTDKVMAHDAQLVVADGQKQIVTGTFQSIKNDKGEWITQEDALANPFYTFENGQVRFVESPNMRRLTGGLPGVGGMTNTIVPGAVGYPSKLVSGDANVPNVDGKCCTNRVVVWDFAGRDVVGSVPSQIFMPYLGNLDQFKDVESIGGKGIPHVYRIYGRDLNHDGHQDLLVAQSLWTQANNDWPSALQVMLNDGTGKFVDQTARLNSEMPLLKNELGYAPTFVDLDGSGIESILWDGSFSWGVPKRFSDYLILNDGTGRLYLGIHDKFLEMSVVVKDFLKGVDRGYDLNNAIRFIGIPQPNGSVNYVAASPSGAPASSGLTKTVYQFVNVPISYDPTVDFIRDVTISDRNSSKRMRTWAGDDVIYDKGASLNATINGGLGRNTVVYSGPSSAYSMEKKSNGTLAVATVVSGAYPAVRDVLTNIQVVRFADKSIVVN